MKTLIIMLIISLVTGCKISPEEVGEWSGQPPLGYQKLAAYALDLSRPIEDRLMAIDHLREKEAYGYLLHILDEMKPHVVEGNQVGDEDYEKQLYQHLYEQASKGLIDGAVGTHPAMNLAFYLMSREQGRALFETTEGKQKVEWMFKYCAELVRSQRAVPKNLDVDGLFIAMLHLSHSTMLKWLEEDLMKDLNDIAYLVKVNKLAMELNLVDADLMMARVLLAAGQKLYPNKLTVPLIEVMAENGNLTLHRFMLDMSRDFIAPQKVRERAMVIAIDRLKKEGKDQYFDIITSTRATSRSIFYTLREGIWKNFGLSELKRALLSIPSNFRRPVSGSELKEAIEAFCVNQLMEKNREVRPILLEVLSESMKKDGPWPARLYAITCLKEINPDEFRSDLKRYFKQISKDKTKIASWRSDREVTFQEIIDDYMN